MIDLGMSSFTIFEFLEWWFFTDSKKRYVNQIPFQGNPLALRPYAISNVLGRSQDDDGYGLSAWRFEGYNFGIYKKYSLLDPAPPGYEVWEYYNNNPEAKEEDRDNYSLGDVVTRRFFDKKYNRITKRLEDEPGFEGVYATDLITMNDYYNLNFDGSEDKLAIDDASRKLLKDIRRSKNSGHLSWKNKVTYYLDYSEIDGNIEGTCPREEDFEFKLFLFTKNRPGNRTQSQVFPEIKLAAPAIGADGINKKGSADGESTAVADDSPNNKVGGNLNHSYRSLTGSFSAGSEQIYGIINSDTVPAAIWMAEPSDWAENLDIESHFSNPDGNSYLTPGTGLAIPIDIQNANPFQWAPNYANPSGCRGENKEKVKLRVFNMSPSQFNKGDAVTLTDRYGLWFIDPVASSVITPVVTRKPVRNWQFTYFLTNEPHYLRFADAWQESNPYGEKDIYTHLNQNARHRDAEYSISRKYFKTHLKQGYKEWFDNLTFLEKDNGTAWRGYAQITSWDFMGREFAGLREEGEVSRGNALVLTNAAMDHTGDTADFAQIYNSYGTQGVAKITAPFFGCTFPDGYKNEDKYVNVNGKGVDGLVVPYLTGSGWRVNGFKQTEGVTQNDSFFNNDVLYTPMSDVDDISYISSGIFDPTSPHNNKSTNIAPYYFLTNDQKQGDNEEPHCNLFSSGPPLYHLPADMAVNASWESANGGPIMSLNKVQQYITTTFFKDGGSPGSRIGVKWDDYESIQNSFHDFWLDSGSFQWLWDTIDRKNRKSINDPNNSAFDLTPANVNRVQFRPARDVLFAQFDPPQYEPEARGPFRVAEFELPYPGAFLAEIGFTNWPAHGGSITGQVGLSTYGGKVPLWGKKTKERLLHNDAEGIDGLFQYQQNFASDPDLDGYVMPFKYEVYDANEPEWVGTTTNWHVPIQEYCKNPVVGNNSLGSSPFGNKSRGMFGVIGATCTATVTDEGLEFQTNSYVGQPMWYNQLFRAAFGGRALDYFSPNSTALYVKIYESWPRDQLIYDPRFFAVHHFNEGNKLPIGFDLQGVEKRPWQSTYRYGEQITHTVSGEPEIEYSSGVQKIGYTDVSYYPSQSLSQVSSGVPIAIGKEITSVDLRFPSFYNGVIKPGDAGNKTARILALSPLEKMGYYVLNEGVIPYGTPTGSLLGQKYRKTGDSSIEILDNPFPTTSTEYTERQEIIEKYSKYTPLANPQHWLINPDRRARMLPWTYEMLEIAPAVPRFIDFTEVKPEDTLHKIVVEDQRGSIIVKSSGENYSVGDKFEVRGGSGSGAKLEVTEVGEAGNIAGFKWESRSFTFYEESFLDVSHGAGYLQDDFLNGEATGISVDTTSSLKIVPSSGTNRTFVGYFTHGSVYYDNKKIDFKPRIATTEKGPYRLSIGDNTLQETGSETWRDTMDIEIIPMGQGVILGDGTSTIGQPGLGKTDAMAGTTVTQIVINPEGDENPNVVENEYDCFFYCVNDASHTLVDSAAIHIAVENYIDLEVKAY